MEIDYEKEYKEALERAKRLRDSKYQTMNAKRVAEEIFPVLAECEDERIRKFLVKHVSEWIGCIEHDLKISSKDIESEEELAMFKAGLAYLEKQKEQKPVDYNEYKMLMEGAREHGKTEGRKEVIDHPEEYVLQEFRARFCFLPANILMTTWNSSVWIRTIMLSFIRSSLRTYNLNLNLYLTNNGKIH